MSPPLVCFLPRVFDTLTRIFSPTIYPRVVYYPAYSFCGVFNFINYLTISLPFAVLPGYVHDI